MPRSEATAWMGGDWRCPACGFLNWKRNRTCNSGNGCQEVKPGAAEDPNVVPLKNPRWVKQESPSRVSQDRGDRSCSGKPERGRRSPREASEDRGRRSRRRRSSEVVVLDAQPKRRAGLHRPHPPRDSPHPPGRWHSEPRSKRPRRSRSPRETSEEHLEEDGVLGEVGAVHGALDRLLPHPGLQAVHLEELIQRIRITAEVRKIRLK